MGATVNRMGAPSIPPQEAEALFAALFAHYEGDELPMARWARVTQPKWLGILRRWAPRWVDEEDLLHDVLRDACKAVRAKMVVKSPGGWLSTVVFRRVLKLMRWRAKEKEKEKDGLDGCSDPRLGPSALAEIQEEESIAGGLLAQLPPPYGYALYLQFALGMTRAEIREMLSEYRPVGLARVDRILLEGREMLHVAQAGGDSREEWPMRYDPGRNPWIGSSLPPIEH